MVREIGFKGVSRLEIPAQNDRVYGMPKVAENPAKSGFAELIGGGKPASPPKITSLVGKHMEVLLSGLKPTWQDAICKAVGVMPEKMRIDACRSITGVIKEGVPEALA